MVRLSYLSGFAAVTLMREVTLFVEDVGHQSVITALIDRLSRDAGVEVAIRSFSNSGGRGAVMAHLRQFVRNLEESREILPDLVVVALDGNCQGYMRWRGAIQRAAPSLGDLLVCAVPEPHVERWLLVDQAAFRVALGKACPKPDLKCERDRYNRLLIQAVAAAGKIPTLGGLEYAAAIVEALDFKQVHRTDRSLERFVLEVRRKLTQWQPR